VAIETSIYSRLTAYAGVADLVSTRVYPVVMPQNTSFPAITYQTNAREKNPTFGADSTISNKEMRITSWASTYSGAKDLAAEVLAALNRWSSGDVQEVFHEDEGDTYNEELDKYGVYMDFTVWFDES
jgi:hypothetical protein